MTFLKNRKFLLNISTRYFLKNIYITENTNDVGSILGKLFKVINLLQNKNWSRSYGV